jgi:hypothetical protein
LYAVSRIVYFETASRRLMQNNNMNSSALPNDGPSPL